MGACGGSKARRQQGQRGRRRISATPPRYAVSESYRDQAGFEAHRIAPHTAAFLARADELLAGPPEVLVLEPGDVS